MIYFIHKLCLMHLKYTGIIRGCDNIEIKMGANRHMQFKMYVL